MICVMSQCGLLEMFPLEGGAKDPTQRMIPFLPGMYVCMYVCPVHSSPQGCACVCVCMGRFL